MPGKMINTFIFMNNDTATSKNVNIYKMTG